MLTTSAPSGRALCYALLRAASSGSSGVGAAAQQQHAWRGYAAAGADSAVKEVTNDAEFDREIKALAANNTLGVVDFTAKWCGPCRAVAPVYEQLSKQYPQAVFLKVDIDNEQLQRTVMDHGITGVPTFAFYKGARRVESFTGARVDLLKSTVEKLK